MRVIFNVKGAGFEETDVLLKELVKLMDGHRACRTNTSHTSNKPQVETQAPLFVVLKTFYEFVVSRARNTVVGPKYFVQKLKTTEVTHGITVPLIDRSSTVLVLGKPHQMGTDIFYVFPLYFKCMEFLCCKNGSI